MAFYSKQKCCHSRCVDYLEYTFVLIMKRLIILGGLNKGLSYIDMAYTVCYLFIKH